MNNTSHTIHKNHHFREYDGNNNEPPSENHPLDTELSVSPFENEGKHENVVVCVCPAPLGNL